MYTVSLEPLTDLDIYIYHENIDIRRPYFITTTLPNEMEQINLMSVLAIQSGYNLFLFHGNPVIYLGKSRSFVTDPLQSMRMSHFNMLNYCMGPHF